jgi:hypothetical protein
MEASIVRSCQRLLLLDSSLIDVCVVGFLQPNNGPGLSALNGEMLVSGTSFSGKVKSRCSCYDGHYFLWT